MSKMVYTEIYVIYMNLTQLYNIKGRQMIINDFYRSCDKYRNFDILSNLHNHTS